MKIVYDDQHLQVSDHFFIRIEQSESKAARFRVTYGKQVKSGLTYEAAAHEFGACFFHRLACEGAINNEGA